MKNYKIEDLGMSLFKIYVSNDLSELGVWVKTHLKDDLHDLFITFKKPNLIVDLTDHQATFIIDDDCPFLYRGEEYIKLIIEEDWGEYSFNDSWITLVPNFVAELAEAIDQYINYRISDFFSIDQLQNFATNQGV